MEQPRYRAVPGGGSSGAAWNGTCGHPRGATSATSATSATTPGAAGGGGGHQSGERDPRVPNPGDVPNPRVPNPGVPNPGDVPSPGVASSRDIPNPGVPNPGVPNPRVPTPEGVASPGSVPNIRSVTNPRNVPNSAGVASPGNVSIPGGVPIVGTVTNSGSVPSPWSVPNPRNVPSPEGVPNPRNVPSPEGVASPGGIPNTGSVTNPGDVPTPEGVPSPDTVPTPGGRCRCRGPPAAPPSPTRDIPCGLGCRHRAPPEGTGDTRRARRRPRQRHEEPDTELGDSGRGQRASLRVARAGVALCLRLLGALLALLLLFLLLILGGLRSSLRGGSAGLRRCRELLGERLRPRASCSGGGGEQEVTRLVAMAQVAEEELDPFRVLGVEPTASDAELRRAYRRLAVLVHPDKSRDPRAEAAFKVLRAGWERVSSPERRREYETKQLAQGELARALGAFLGRLQEELRDAMDAMGCTRCGGRHRRFPLDRDPRSARYCAECGAWHAADEGDLWAESSLLGLKVTYLARMDGHVYDVTEWAGCQRVAISPDSHRVPYHLSFGARTATPAGRQRAPPKGSPPSPSEIQDFLARVFQGNPSSGEAGGAFPTPPGAAGPPQGPPQAQGGAPRGDTKHKRRKKGRRPLPR